MRDAQRFGFDEAAIAAIREALAGPAEQSDDDVWPENSGIAAAFAQASTQWRAVTAGDRLLWIGLDYSGARAGIEAAGIAVTPALWEGLRIMELAARDALNQIEG